MLIILFILLSLSSVAQCDIPPTRSGNSTIVSSSNGDILINGLPCDQLGNSSNYNCDTINLNVTLTVEDGGCIWTIIDGDWDNPIPQSPLSVILVYFIGYNLNNITTLEWKVESEFNTDYYLIQGSDDLLSFINISSTQSGSHLYTMHVESVSYSYYRLIEVDINNNTSVLSTIYCLKSFYTLTPHVAQGMYIVKSKNFQKKIIIF